jgi:hypothetical protein
MSEQQRLYMVFDVESVGLHGEGFMCGWVVVDRAGVEQISGWIAAPPECAEGTEDGLKWVREHVPNLPFPHGDAYTPKDVRFAFWKQWLQWKGQGATLWADCAWPVEARFLRECVNDAPEEREWEGPYPLHEIATLMRAIGRDPLAYYDRLPNELPQHDPLADARQSARLLVECLDALGVER